MATLTGNTIASTYDSLIKTAANQPVGAAAATLSDGVGNQLPMAVSTTGITFTGGVVFTSATITGLATSDLTNDSGFITIADVNTATGSLSASLAVDIASNTAGIATNAGDISTNSGLISTNTADIVTLTNASASFAADIITNTNLIGINLASINSNNNDITALQGDVITNAGNIASNDADIADLFTSASSALVTASVSLNTITFEKGDGTTFPITVDTGSGGGGGTPAGSDTQVQYNDAGAFGASANFTFNDVTNTLAVTGDLKVSKDVYVTGSHYLYPTDATNTYSGEILSKLGSSLTVGKVYYLNSSGIWVIADNTAEATTAPMLAVAVSTTELMIRGHIRNVAYAGYTMGTSVYLDAGGAVTNTQPSTPTHFVRKLGYSYDGGSRTIWFDPSQEYYEIS